MGFPPFTKSGDLPPGVHGATLRDVLDRFGVGSAQRRAVALRVERAYEIAVRTGHLARFVLFGSFVTAKADPNDVDIFPLMEGTFDASSQTAETRLLFDHPAAQAHFGASVSWLRRLAALEGDQAAVESWEVTREGGRRGIVEIISEVT